ncbi:hypothetical protein [Natronorarus salvus]|uniref:hypothetical protein n=1 Tax=Natronorarus salvus TaxID=3117733 RepID=UPI002F25FF0D
MGESTERRYPVGVLVLLAVPVVVAAVASVLADDLQWGLVVGAGAGLGFALSVALYRTLAG